MLTVFEFLGIASGSVLLLLVLMCTMERAVQRASGGRLNRSVRILVCLGGALLILGISAYGMGQPLVFKAVLLGGFIIVLNRYWLGHFTVKQHS